MLSEFVGLSNGNVLAATETFDQSTGNILSVLAKTETQDDFVTQGIWGDVGMVLYQHKGANVFLTMNPFSGSKFTGMWKPPIKPQYQFWTMSADDGNSNAAAYQISFETLTYVFASNIANDTFEPQISLQSISGDGEFFQPLIALDFDGRENAIGQEGRGRRSDLQPDGPHKCQAVTLRDNALAQFVVEGKTAIGKLFLKMDVSELAVERAADLSQRQIMGGDESDRSSLQQGMKHAFGADPAIIRVCALQEFVE